MRVRYRIEKKGTPKKDESTHKFHENINYLNGLFFFSLCANVIRRTSSAACLPSPPPPPEWKYSLTISRVNVYKWSEWSTIWAQRSTSKTLAATHSNVLSTRGKAIQMETKENRNRRNELNTYFSSIAIAWQKCAPNKKTARRKKEQSNEIKFKQFGTHTQYTINNSSRMCERECCFYCNVCLPLRAHFIAFIHFKNVKMWNISHWGQKKIAKMERERAENVL